MVDLVSDDSFYCGDAAGRLKGWDGNRTTKKDFSCSDRKFAANIGVKFFTPEEFFLSQPAVTADKWEWGGIDPKQLIALATETAVAPMPEGSKELLIMVGCPASGKSTFSKSAQFSQYMRICADEIGTKKKCITIADRALRNGKSVIIDSTNPAPVTRAEWIDVARECGVESIRCVHVDTPRAIAEHMNAFREKVTGKKRIPALVYNIYYKKFVAPDISEGFSEVIRLPFMLVSDPELMPLFLEWS
jgi:bifunctional polynucleotide phosphatase/kinase